MVITYNGIESCKVQFGDTVLAFNPVSKHSKHKAARFGADIALVTVAHPDMNGVETVSRGERTPFVINGPGEYEVGGVFVQGFSSVSEYGGEQTANTVYLVRLEGMHLLFLGALSEPLTPDVLEAIDEVDVLFVPIGGEGVLDAVAAHKLAVKLEAKVIIPMHYGSVGGKKALATFLKEEGAEAVVPVEKLTLKHKDITDASGTVAVLSEA